ncbi:MAG: hypothetical protein AB1776_04760 [Bacillota bacterium]
MIFVKSRHGSDIFPAPPTSRERRAFRRHLAAGAKIIALYAGAVIGAGFASGQEILQFFALFGRAGIWGAALVGLLFAYLGAVVLGTATGVHSTSYRGIISRLLGPYLGTVVDLLSICVLFGGLAVMLAGSGAVARQQFGLHPVWGVLGLALLTSLVVSRGLEGVVEVNAVIVPVKVAIVSVISLWVLFPGASLPVGAVPDPAAGNWGVAALLYVSYNLIIPVAVLASVGRYTPRAAGMAGAAAGGLLLGGLAALMAAALARYVPQVAAAQVPLLYMANLIHPALARVAAAVIWLAIFTTAVAEAHGLAARMAPPGTRRYCLCGIGAVLCAAPAAALGFPELVGIFYPLFGYAGLLLMVPLAFTPFAGIWRKTKKHVR